MELKDFVAGKRVMIKLENGTKYGVVGKTLGADSETLVRFEDSGVVRITPEVAPFFHPDNRN